MLALPGLSVDSDLQGRGLGLVSGWSVDSVAGAARVRLALARPAEVRRRFLLPPADGEPTYRYVIDLEPVLAGVTAQPAAYAPRVMPARILTPTRATVGHARKVIVIDPGHGGHDPGALGSMSREKDLNLASARALRAKLEATGRYRVVMTRDLATSMCRLTSARADRAARQRRPVHLAALRLRTGGRGCAARPSTPCPTRARSGSCAGSPIATTG